ncbi:MAG: hypothetical protein AAF725_25990, partial [Acidobacteriota bacterium]
MPEKTLNRALLVNVLFSAGSAAECLLFSGWMSRFLGVPEAAVQGLGVGLAVFAVTLFALLKADLKRPWARSAVAVVIALDALWVVGSVALLLSPTSLTVAGQWTVGGVAFC